MINRYVVRSKIISATRIANQVFTMIPALRPQVAFCSNFHIRKLGLVNLSRVTVAPVMPSAPLAAVVLGNFSSALHHLTLQ
jgi:hypothetical protein